MERLRRLNLGCGPCARPGWVNVDKLPAAGVDLIGDLRSGLPVASGTVECIVAVHVLQDLPYLDIPVALAEIKRMLAPGGWLRLGLPDLDKAMQAYLAGDHAYFHVPDSDAKAIGTKLITQLVWYGSVRTPFTFDYIEELLIRQGFRRVYRCNFQETRSPHPDITTLDNRPRESLFVEATT
ncbi:MAG TPA: methyltransferase domain-containing protein [Nitrospiraceae bacterium]|nr:methyltransferase domain-containing protein [Nitrospiraceae bacterium]